VGKCGVCVITTDKSNLSGVICQEIPYPEVIPNPAAQFRDDSGVLFLYRRVRQKSVAGY
jgi:hypothetical protein